MWVCTKKLSKGTFHWPRTDQAHSGALQVLADEYGIELSCKK